MADSRARRTAPSFKCPSCGTTRNARPNWTHSLKCKSCGTLYSTDSNRVYQEEKTAPLDDDVSDAIARALSCLPVPAGFMDDFHQTIFLEVMSVIRRVK